ncbi:hypothetical protein D9M71_744300 [compost metagenome]
MQGEQGRDVAKQGVFARAERGFHHRVHFGQPCLGLGLPRQHVAQTAPQLAGGDLHGALLLEAMLAVRRERGLCGGFRGWRVAWRCHVDVGEDGIGQHSADAGALGVL